MESHYSKVSALIKTWIGYYSNAKTLMTTRWGYMGLSPATAQEGDLIARLHGFTSPLEHDERLIRVTSEAKQLNFVGPAWITGVVPEDTECIMYRVDAAVQGASKD